jgi:hypothetical protein
MTRCPPVCHTRRVKIQGQITRRLSSSIAQSGERSALVSVQSAGDLNR